MTRAASELRPIPGPEDPPARWTAVALPSYRHVPGLTPHPVNHPRGHSHGAGSPVAPPRGADLPDGWRRCEAYLLGVDLFNRAYFWEAHEAWEEVWHAAGHRSLPGRMAQGQIQVAAALLKRHMEVPAGARRLFEKAGRRFDAVERWLRSGGGRDSVYMGVDLPAWRDGIARYLEAEAAPFPFLRLVGPG